jgi:coenzyme F420-0:L-glutamate ligase/coenzyme F420-1:gamma-L-glutamate ligase
MSGRLVIEPVEGLPEIGPGDRLGELIAGRADLADGDIVVVSQKAVSKAEGRVRRLDSVVPGEEAKRLAASLGREAALVQLVLDESREVLRAERGVLIVETHHGFVCANAGIDLSNVDDGWAALLPVDGDRSARRIRDGIRAACGVEVAVVISDTFGRPWRHGLVDVAIGVAGLAAVVDLRGTEDDRGRALQVTEVAVADEVASAAELVMGKARGIPAALVRGLDAAWLRDSSIGELIRPTRDDLFR